MTLTESPLAGAAWQAGILPLMRPAPSAMDDARQGAATVKQSRSQSPRARP
jgi:hypothetical protein